MPIEVSPRWPGPTRRQVLAGGAAGLASLLAASGCSRSAAGPRLLTIPREDMGTFTRNFNPFTTNSAPMTGQAIYEPLLIVNPLSGEITPWLAESWAMSDDAASLTFHLRPGVTWSDGRPLVAKDVVTTFAVHRAVAGGYDYLDSVTANNATAVTLTFTRPNSVALQELGSQLIAPDHVWSAISEPAKYPNPAPIATGPFTKVTSFQTQSFDLMPNPTYWGSNHQGDDASASGDDPTGTPSTGHTADHTSLPGIRMLAFAGNDSANLAAVSGDVDWAPQYMADIQTAYIDKDPAHRHYWFPGADSTIQWTLNTTKAPYNDPAFRKALSQAIDRKTICATGMSGYAQPADPTGLGEGFRAWKDPAVAALPLCTYDKAAATAALDAAGYRLGADSKRMDLNGKPLALTIQVGSTSSDWLSVARIIVQNLADIGISATVDSPDWTEVTAALETGTFETAVCWSSLGATPYTYYEATMSTQKVKPIGTHALENYHRFGDEQATALLGQLAATTDQARQIEICHQIQQRYADQLPVIPLFPGPVWGAYTDEHFTGWPSQDNPYASLSTRAATTVLVLNSLRPRA
ncbi:ABC transporter substrate-binding protein [Actinomyces sp. oral taxon 170]|uniref:ABC transporter substrate-binding protein n=1 Tax=Actinomyces sp. oral taxon 170 TaxID=712117 RepID=UPI000205C209|nr:ABC transporter substrate-binding protein [Actinomyces sp. oral taxon 170]EGF57741.1 Tat pathway signal sequence domain protein [Actinomyces sp. oral taxon 170 str. F0386]